MCYTDSNVRFIVNDELEIMWKETAMVSCKVLYHCVTGGTEENDDHRYGYLVSMSSQLQYSVELKGDT
jgi:hypothetical protein